MSKDKIEVNMNVYDIPILVEALEEANKEIERLKNIIKEVREYCDKEIGNIIANFDYIDTKDLESIRKILDKGSEKE